MTKIHSGDNLTPILCTQPIDAHHFLRNYFEGELVRTLNLRVIEALFDFLFVSHVTYLLPWGCFCPGIALGGEKEKPNSSLSLCLRCPGGPYMYEAAWRCALRWLLLLLPSMAPPPTSVERQQSNPLMPHRSRSRSAGSTKLRPVTVPCF